MTIIEIRHAIYIYIYIYIYIVTQSKVTDQYSQKDGFLRDSPEAEARENASKPQHRLADKGEPFPAQPGSRNP